MSAAERLRTARGTKSRKEVAEAVGVSISAMAMYETGHRVPKDAIKQKLADYYGQTVQVLFFNQ